MWRIDGDDPRPLAPAAMPSERELQEFLRRDPTLLGERLLIIGNEVITPFGKRLDLLAIDADGNLHVLELKRDKTPREVVAQLLDYGSWVSTLSRPEILDIAEKELGQPLEVAFENVFGASPPDEINGELQLTVVASSLDASSERIVTYLRGFGVPINAVFFSYLEDDGRRYLARSWLVASDEGSAAASSSVTKSKRAGWNGVDWYVAFGSGRSWDEARDNGFVSAGGGAVYSQILRTIPVGARVWVHIPRAGYVGVGRVIAPATRFDQASVKVDGEWTPLAERELAGSYVHGGVNAGDDSDDLAEWILPVEWIASAPLPDAYWETGLFSNMNVACKLRQEFTLERLAAHFGIDDES
ncbi:endonuclease NucS domain-containing protein [Schumannella soli]|nr:endonuclease NucS domain-containing protein [Schumannella soli]